ncbi:vacuolar protein [Cryptococcus neoformans c45]|nr:vacuolar protein [Cryptococcus neoformans var. grubii c45]
MAQTATEGGPFQSIPMSNHAASSVMTENKPSKSPMSKIRLSSCSRPRNGPKTPDPLIQRKSAVVVVFALSIWSFYVIVGRMCTPMIRNRSDSGLGRSVGAGTLVGFVILWLFSSWSYVKMIVTPPGYARDKVHKSSPPDPANYPQPYPINPNTVQPNQDQGPDPSIWAPTMNLATQTVEDWHPNSSSAPFTGQAPPPETKDKQKKGLKDWREVQRPVPHVEYVPRWCRFCEIVKPDRTHHCRHCGTCVMQFDHHCLWIGQCVGWANHKFFIIFNLWTALYCFYIMILLIITEARSNNMDGQMIALIIIAAIFGLFAVVMLLTHIQLILSGRTTVESFAARDQHERENALLQTEYGYFWHNMEKRKVRKKWKEEWGGSPVDGRWRYGTRMDRWKQEMGIAPLGWILPIGSPQGDGLHFKSNPKFGPHGEWLKKKDWPTELLTV